ncbi:oocyte zinc finger protein XlCOF22-like [Ochlerotatus camptorhynchus]|uniref:oocyte zinc finger protein XlCOF22-like n=1 Tax=Ochlerotatus camptorhynchus TaxID=644619 RepID=UPI0031DD427E
MNGPFLPSQGLDFNTELTAAAIAAVPLNDDSTEEQAEKASATVAFAVPQSTSADTPDASDGGPAAENPKIIYLDRVCRTCLVEKEKEQLKDLFEFCLAETVMACVNISIEESDGLPCHICLDCLQEVERILNFRQMCDRSDVTIRNLIEKSVVINQDSQTKYEVLNVVLTDANGNTETSAVVVPIEELRFQLMNGGSATNVVSSETISIPIMELNDEVELSGFNNVVNTENIKIDIPKGSLEVGFSTPTDLLVTEESMEETLVEEDLPITVNPSELLNEATPTPSLNDIDPEGLIQDESTTIDHLKQELSEFIGSGCADIPKDQELDDNDDDEMIHVDYLKDALTEEYIQIMEKQLASSVTRSNNPLQDRLEQEHFDSLINDEERIQVGDQQDCLDDGRITEDETDGDDKLNDDDGKGCHCRHCDIEFEDNRQYKKHMRKHSEKRFECEYCSRKFAEQSLLRNHTLRHTGEKAHVCEVCNARFYEKNLLNMHMRTHGDERPYACDTCGKRFKTKSLLNTHSKIHLGEKSHVCTVCGKGFTLSWQLKAHTRIHTNERPFECQYCHKRFNQNGNLMIHIRIHTGERPFQCTLCEKAYPSQGELSGHMRQHTGEKKVKKITCTVCSKAFAGNGDLKIHMRTHTKERPYTCQLCGKSFMLHVHLTVHMRSHTGEKPFACTICEKAFATNYQLKNHTFVHTGEKNYACEVCNRRFSSLANRNTHRKTHDRKIS